MVKIEKIDNTKKRDLKNNPPQKEVLNLINSLSITERKIIPFLAKTIDYDALLKISGMKEIEVQRALMYLSNKGVLNLLKNMEERALLDTNGKKYLKEGLPEKRVLEILNKKNKLSLNEIQKNTKLSTQEISVSIGILRKNNAINIEKRNNNLFLFITSIGKTLFPKIKEEEEFLKSNFPIEIHKLTQKQKRIFNKLKSRKQILKLEKVKKYKIKITPLGNKLLKSKRILTELSNFVDVLDSNLIKTGEWKQKKFRAYDIASGVPKIFGGRRHPLSEAKNLIRDIFIQMGFKEMEGPWVETQFWCMDSMWIPQDHPARDVQDTFFIGKKGKLPDKKLVNEVKECQENGGKTGSTGHKMKWSEEKAKELVLRTHSTAATFRKFGEFLKSKKYPDCKYFYIANNFRNEAVDATHLAEFLQAEGFIMADDLTLTDLMGFIKEFYAKLGITKIKFKPTFNPYTEPSMEAHYYDEKKKKWYALINSGIFRPEALAPFGIKKRVIAWGMGASRIATILFNKNNLKELVGPEVDFKWIKNHKIPFKKTI